MSRPTRAVIDLDAVRHNCREAKRLAPGTRALAMIKANAYGHGAVAVARALATLADGFGVACLEEALELRESGIANPVVLMAGACAPDEVALAVRASLDLVIHRPEQIDWVLAARPARPLRCWLKLDSGMHRLGLEPAAFRAAHATLSACPWVGELIAMTHLACADDPASPLTAAQLDCFAATVEGLPLPRSLANSAAVLGWPATHGDWIRPGLMLYGVSPFDAEARHGGTASARLRPAMCLESALIAVRELRAGDTIGYGARFRCAAPTRVGVIAAGYADGYPREAPDGTPVWIRGQRTRIIGRVSMDLVTIDLTGIPGAGIGDRVELWGGQVGVTEVARASGTIAYPLLTGVSARVRREWPAHATG